MEEEKNDEYLVFCIFLILHFMYEGGIANNRRKVREKG